MKIHFCLAWTGPGASRRKAFKSAPSEALFAEYVKRIRKFHACEYSGTGPKDHLTKARAKIWLCDRGQGASMFSSEELARRFSLLQSSGIRELCIVIGGPDGFRAPDFKLWNPELKWSFGPLTLPHELAAVVSAEQIYRALTILHHLPYHAAH